MNKHFNIKSLAFYGGAIGFVLVLFSVATSYGETHLKAASPVDGRYTLSAEDLPGCLKSDKLALDVQQSGVYLTGSLINANANEKTLKSAEQRPSLSGRWDGRNLTMAGSLNHLNNCDGTVQIQAMLDQKELNGKLSLDASPEATFTAQQEQEKPQGQGQAH